MLHEHWSRLNVFARDGERKADFGEEKLIKDESIVGRDIRDSQGSDDVHGLQLTTAMMMCVKRNATGVKDVPSSNL